VTIINFKEWYEIPETKEFLNQLKIEGEKYLDDILNLSGSGDDFIRDYNRKSGFASGILFVLAHAKELKEKEEMKKDEAN
jgi:hypothetical protein